MRQVSFSTAAAGAQGAEGYHAVGGCGSNVAWRTEHDLTDIADRDNLMRDIKVYAQALRRRQCGDLAVRSDSGHKGWDRRRIG